MVWACAESAFQIFETRLKFTEVQASSSGHLSGRSLPITATLQLLRRSQKSNDRAACFLSRLDHAEAGSYAYFACEFAGRARMQLVQPVCR